MLFGHHPNENSVGRVTPETKRKKKKEKMDCSIFLVKASALPDKNQEHDGRGAGPEHPLGLPRSAEKAN